jgi:hypothetical protein
MCFRPEVEMWAEPTQLGSPERSKEPVANVNQSLVDIGPVIEITSF